MERPDQFWILISRKLTGEASDSELWELEQFIRDNPGIQPFMEIATAMWNSGSQINMPELEQAYSQHIERMKRQVPEIHESKKPIRVNKNLIRVNKSNAWKTGLRLFNPGIFANYFKVIYRNLYRFKSFTVINITGLAIGMASAILILLLVENELSYDQFHEKKDRIYSLYNRGMLNGHMEIFGTPSVLTTRVKIRISAGGGSDPPQWNRSDRALRE